MTPIAFWFLVSVVGALVLAGLLLSVLERPAVLRALPFARAGALTESAGIQLIMFVGGIIVVVAAAFEGFWPAVFGGIALTAIGSAPFFPTQRARTVVHWTGLIVLWSVLILSITERL